ncbi:deoxyribodipyrimidine photo-lyase family protein (cryptochrome) [Roseovarius nanhaiticus]|uniref:Deoxyribodipyrimidine photo-lyase family protein (Cryptochrome) n=1 Tax=Roseovarius nanhaiticus TaxID=573024 RepID=A0A1N7GX48_9RHOB|nr:FAD-binding domain-containing protein [Roseovarius nanhaiticus]SEL21074.1 deoxyribodipyrimidine photo-lyase family protein (cryptochrome) [Roseovarius nanhaiticus]SIS17139.1 deoxyribodipyrimidine photo-lyase family protein (cryptochrome) [Roseovarius nanhaiticus]
MSQFPPTRAAGLERMDAFVPAMGRRYANGRNYDRGPGNHKAVSTLSPYLRRRLVTEEEVVTAALDAHGPENAEKFVQEVVWRSYFKGWLERRPEVWDSYASGLDADLAALDRDRRLSRDVARAMDGQTGLDCFDAWAEELVSTGYLHNHARMWFASIWIFTLGLPWRMGADFFYRHLLDGDAASNTLGWRWVAGLHTRGRPYAADPKNIATFTGGRFAPRASDLEEVTEGLEASEPEGLPQVRPVRAPRAPRDGAATAILITDEDCSPERFDLDISGACALGTLAGSHLRSPLEVAPHVHDFEAGALADTAARLGRVPDLLRADHPDTLAKWAHAAGAEQIVTPFVPRGPMRDWLTEAETYLDRQGIVLCELRRDWDSAFWPHATAGFFKVKKKIPALLGDLVAA